MKNIGSATVLTRLLTPLNDNGIISSETQIKFIASPHDVTNDVTVIDKQDNAESDEMTKTNEDKEKSDETQVCEIDMSNCCFSDEQVGAISLSNE